VNAAVSRIAHGELELYNPLSAVDLDQAIDLLDLAPGARALDVACGTGEALRRIAIRWNVRGTGYDRDPHLVERGRRAAPAGVELVVAEEPPAGPFDLVLCIASSHALGGFPEALERLRELVRPGGQVLLGEATDGARPRPSTWTRAAGRPGTRSPTTEDCWRRREPPAWWRSGPALQLSTIGSATSGRRSSTANAGRPTTPAIRSPRTCAPGPRSHGIAWR
jgi:SAM-dependent methyltransferase